MDPIIKSLNEIELRASSVIKEAEREKTRLLETYEQETRKWDEELEADTARRIQEMQRAAENRSAAVLASEQELTGRRLQALQASYDRYHELYVDRLFEQLLQE